MPDPVDLMAEVDAMRKIAEALKPLQPDAAARVLRWALDSYRGRALTESGSIPGESTLASPSAQFTDIAELFAAAAPKHGPDKALVAAYWVQQMQGRPDFDAQSINNELKHLGHGVANITLALGALISQRPQLVIQLRKEGTSRQARKRYKLTREGIQKVEQMMKRETD